MFADPYQIPNLQQNKVFEEQEAREIESLKIRLKSLEDSYRALQQNYEEAINDSEESYKTIKELETKVEGYEKVAADMHKKEKIIAEYKNDKKTLESELENAEKNWKSVNKSLKIKEKEIHDLYNLCGNILLSKTCSRKVFNFSHVCLCQEILFTLVESVTCTKFVLSK